MTKYTFKEFQAEYPDDGACLDRIMLEQHGGTSIVCPGCKNESKFHRITKRRAFACQACGHHVYPCAGTIFEKSRTKLTLWFFAMYLMTSTRHGVAAAELERQLGVTYKTAWRMAHELRKLMAQADYQGPLSGHVEVDETHFGGWQTKKELRRDGSNKRIVVGMVERGGHLRAYPIKNLKAETILPVIFEAVEEGTTISTDEGGWYKDLSRAGYDHGTVNHEREEYVRGIHHVNTIEGHWSQLKRGIIGTHIHVSAKHLWKYVAEFSYRRNFRASHRNMFSRLVSSFSLPRLRET
ncbi:MAG: IS1595 family transposase [Micropepsaceae bacterium]